jgi:hypothetical protein
LRFASFILDDESVLWRPPEPTEVGRFNSCGDSEVVAVAATEDDGSIGDRSVGRAWIAWACKIVSTLQNNDISTISDIASSSRLENSRTNDFISGGVELGGRIRCTRVVLYYKQTM